MKVHTHRHKWVIKGMRNSDRISSIYGNDTSSGRVDVTRNAVHTRRAGWQVCTAFVASVTTTGAAVAARLRFRFLTV
ncbi:unannotated protein [freshwater metagenome]|uniref:Unannotated protein n=1 Tax=freshwater metagenome TaxID=449393 RepID=A0A6J7MXF3_9ZZZZ